MHVDFLNARHDIVDMSCGTADEEAGGQRLRNVHQGLPALGVQVGTVHMVDGSYDYHHYMQVRFATHDGCAFAASLLRETCWTITLLSQGLVQMFSNILPRLPMHMSCTRLPSEVACFAC